jgi:hypothetical protein
LEDGTARILFVCPGCRRPVAKLFYYTLPASTLVSELLCRWCHNLSYVSVNCAGNKFYKHVLRPCRQLERIREHLRVRSLPRAKRENLERQEQALEAYLRDAIRKFGRKARHSIAQNGGPHRFSAGGKRAYKSLELASSDLSLKDLAAESRGQRPGSETGNPTRFHSGGALVGALPQGGGSAPSGAFLLPPCKTDQTRPVQGNRAGESQNVPELKMTIDQQLSQHRQSWLETISRWRAEGLITDEQLAQFPALRQFLAAPRQR